MEEGCRKLKERIRKIEETLYNIISEGNCSLNTANWLEVELDEVFSEDCEIQNFVTELALYQPQGGDYLINEKELINKCRHMREYIQQMMK